MGISTATVLFAQVRTHLPAAPQEQAALNQPSPSPFGLSLSKPFPFFKRSKALRQAQGERRKGDRDILPGALGNTDRQCAEMTQTKAAIL